MRFVLPLDVLEVRKEAFRVLRGWAARDDVGRIRP